MPPPAGREIHRNRGHALGRGESIRCVQLTPAHRGRLRFNEPPPLASILLVAHSGLTNAPRARVPTGQCEAVRLPHVAIRQWPCVTRDFFLRPPGLPGHGVAALALEQREVVVLYRPPLTPIVRPCPYLSVREAIYVLYRGGDCVKEQHQRPNRNPRQRAEPKRDAPHHSTTRLRDGPGLRSCA